MFWKTTIATPFSQSSTSLSSFPHFVFVLRLSNPSLHVLSSYSVIFLSVFWRLIARLNFDKFRDTALLRHMHTSVPQVGRGSWQTTRKDITIKYSPYWIQDVFNPNIHSSWKHSFQLSILTTYTKIRISKIKYCGNCFTTSHWDQQKIKNHNLLYTLFLYTNLLIITIHDSLYTLFYEKRR